MNYEEFSNEAKSFIDEALGKSFLPPDVDPVKIVFQYFPTMYMMYIKYVCHHYGDIDADDVETLCDRFITNSYSDHTSADGLVAIKKATLETGNKIDSIVKALEDRGYDFEEAWAMSFYFMTGIEPNPNKADILIAAADGISGYRDAIAPEVECKADVFIEVTQNVASIMRSSISKLEQSFDYPVEFIDAFGLLCAKYFVSHNVSTEVALKYLADSTDSRGYLTRRFIRNTIRKMYPSEAVRAVACVRM